MEVFVGVEAGRLEGAFLPLAFAFFAAVYRPLCFERTACRRFGAVAFVLAAAAVVVRRKGRHREAQSRRQSGVW